MPLSRQEIAFNKWIEDFTKLVLSDRKLSPDARRDIQADIADWIRWPAVHENMIQAFSNFMWGMDRAIEFGVAQELGIIVQMIGKMPAGNSDDGKAIIEMLVDLIESNDKPITEIEDEEIDSLITDEETDDTPIPGVK